MVTDKKSEKRAYWTQKTHLFRADEYICSACGHSTEKAYKHTENGKLKYDIHPETQSEAINNALINSEEL